MKKVIKVSIGNLAFTVEEDGFLLIKGYLDELQDHYSSNESGKEIVEGIEERMAELFVEKSGVNSVVSAAVINEVISILGRPSAIDDQESDVRSASPGVSYSKPVKRLFRNPDNRILGGVCSGLAAYTSLDVTLMRILFIILFFGFSFFGLFHIGSGSLMIITYIVLWIVIPEAKTVEQRCAMYGEPMNFSNIQYKMEQEIKKAGKGIHRAVNERGTGIGRVIAIIFSVVLILFSLSGMALLSFLLLGVEIFKGTLPVDILNFVNMGVVNPLYFKIALMGFLLLPLVGMLYGGIQLLFDFRSPRFRPGLIILLLWIVSLVSLIFLSVQSSRPYWSRTTDQMEIPIVNNYDTLYIKLEAKTEMPRNRTLMSAGYSHYNLFWIDGEKNNSGVVMFPKIKVTRSRGREESVIVSKTYSHSYTPAEAQIKAKEEHALISVTDSLITVLPRYYNKNEKWDGTIQSINVYVPYGVKVIVEKPVRHAFDTQTNSIL